MLIRFAAPFLAIVLTACGPAQVDKVCTVNVKTEQAINGHDLKPMTESKTMVLTINEQSKLLSFNGLLFNNKDSTFYEGMVFGDKHRETSTGPTRIETDISLKYHISTGVIDYAEVTKSL